MKTAYIALGSNLGVPAEHLDFAITQIQKIPQSKVKDISQWYRTSPIGGPANQPDYTNAVCEISTELQPLELLHKLQTIELLAGRTRDIRWGPRTLDLDIIWFEDATSNTQELELPHPRAFERAFVLRPLLDLEAEFELNNETLEELYEKVQHQGLKPL